MARVTVEDCVLRIPNRFELVMLAAQRARKLGAGATLTVDRDNDKNAVVALREIADARVDLKELENALIRGLQKVVEPDEPEVEELDSLTMDASLNLVGDGDALAEELGEDSLSVVQEDGIDLVEDVAVEEDDDREPED